MLPNYPYRDDGILVYNVIKDYVTNVLNIYYGLCLIQTLIKKIKTEKRMIEKGRQMDLIDQINSLLFTTGDATKIQNDDELQSWEKLLSTSVEDGGAGIMVGRQICTQFKGTREMFSV